MQVSNSGGLPENAYRKLNEGEVYRPIIPAGETVPEITARSVILGVIMAVIFSAAAATLGLKAGQVFEAAIPIAILAVGSSALFKRKNTILENVIVQSIGAASGVVVAGAIFTIPGLFILQKEYPAIVVTFFPIFVVSLLGGILGIIFMILFRRYFVSEMHGEFPFPEATATTEVLVAGEKGGDQAKVLVYSMIIAGVYDFLCTKLELWKEVLTTRVIAAGNAIGDATKLVFELNVSAAIMGLGYIIGLRYGAIICAGSFVSCFLLVPVIYHFGQHIGVTIPPLSPGSPLLIKDMNEMWIFKNYVRLIGIGGIACAGIIGIIKSSKIIGQAFTMGFREIFAHKAESAGDQVERTQKDLSMRTIFMVAVASAIAIFVFFRFSVLASMENATLLTVIGLVVVLVISFLFTSVAARAIAIVGSNPVSGMTLMTLILSSVILVACGLKGALGITASLLIGGVVCTALSMAGGFITDLKIGYWIGATPLNQERFKFLGTLVSAATVALVLLLLNQTYGFTDPKSMPAPQANAMAAVIKTFMVEGAAVPWLLYGVGAIIALTMELIGVPPLAFALGMYLPLNLNTPMLFGGLVAHLVAKSSKNEEVAKARNEKGTLITSGYIAGGAIISVLCALMKFVEKQNHWDINLTTFLTWLNKEHHMNLAVGQITGVYCEGLAFFMFLALCIFTYRYATKDGK